MLSLMVSGGSCCKYTDVHFLLSAKVEEWSFEGTLLVRYPQRISQDITKLIRDSDPAVDNVQNGRTDSNGQTWPTTFERFPFPVSNCFTITRPLR